MVKPYPVKSKIEFVDGAVRQRQSRTNLQAMGPTNNARPGLFNHESAGAELGLRHLFEILRRRRKMILSIVTCGTALLVGASFLIPAKYTAVAQIEIIPALAAQGDKPVVVDTHMVMLKSRDFLRKVLLHSDKAAQNPDANTAAMPLGDAQKLAGNRDVDLQVEEFEKHVNVSQLLFSNVIAIRYTSTSRDEAANVANRIATLYSEQLLQRRQDSLQAEIDRLGQRAGELGRSIDAVQARIQKRSQDLPGQPMPASGVLDGEGDLQDLKQHARTNGQVVVDLLRRQNDSRRLLEAARPDVSILSLASAPVKPSSLHPIFFIVPGAILLLIGSSFMAMALEQFDQKLHNEREIVSALAIPCAGQVPALQQRGGLAPQDALERQPFSPYAEAIRSIAATLNLASKTRAPEVILLTSSEADEGKTLLAVSIAQYLAKIGQRVLLVDLDVRTPGLLRALGQDAPSGIIDLVMYNASPEATVQRHPTLAFDYLPMTPGQVDPLKLMASENLLAAFDTFRANYDLILVDGPPALGRSEAALLADMADQVLLVVKCGKTQSVAAQDAVRALSSRSSSGRKAAEFMAAILTQVPTKAVAANRNSDAVKGSVKRKHSPRRTVEAPVVETSITSGPVLSTFQRSVSHTFASVFEWTGKALEPFKWHWPGP